MNTIIRTTFQVPAPLLHRLKVQAAKEQTDVSRLLCKMAEEYLGRLPKKEWAGGLPVQFSGVKRKKGGE